MSEQVKANDHEQYATLTIISFLLPVVGIALGIIFLTKEKTIDRKLGEHLIAFSIFASIIVALLWFMLAAM